MRCSIYADLYYALLFMFLLALHGCPLTREGRIWRSYCLSLFPRWMPYQQALLFPFGGFNISTYDFIFEASSPFRLRWYRWDVSVGTLFGFGLSGLWDGRGAGSGTSCSNGHSLRTVTLAGNG
jgi:hypothetical protein